ncbi:unnamed protein product [Ilex paraguariensis]|uniref:Uncharacterized protein n=1 Tax=Ilex paraguariensis TaxID=185542 RepID=A0ABC8RTZ8_9AQUA
MKASLKFREDQKPLFRAKIPLNIVGFPFQSGVVAGESKELSLNLSTFFDSGPSFKFAYRPNDSINPFSLVFKTGIGHFGSPISSSVTMSAEFNYVGSQNPSFFVHFKPQFGDFNIKKSLSSNFVKKIDTKTKGVVLDEDNSVELTETPMIKSGYLSDKKLFSGNKIIVLPSNSPASGMVESVLSGMELSARTTVPVRNRAMVNFRWGVRFPAEEEAAVVVGRSDRMAGIALRRIPLLVMNKIGIEHVAKDESKETKKVGQDLNYVKNADVAGACLDPDSPGGGGSEMGKYREGERGGIKNLGRRSNGDKKSSELNGFDGKDKEGNVYAELKMMGGGTGS